MNHSVQLAAGLVVLIASDVVLASASSWVDLRVRVALWGVHMSVTQGLLSVMVPIRPLKTCAARPTASST